MTIKEKIVGFIRIPSNFYILFALITGVLIAVILPPFRGPDEAAHTFRVYEIASGDLFLNSGTSPDSDQQGNGYMITESLLRVNQAGFKNEGKSFSKQTNYSYEAGQRKHHDKEKFEIFEGAGIYSPLSYLNYLVPAALTQSFGLNAYIYTLLLRIGGLLVSIGLVYIAIRITPLGKWFMVAIGLLPMSLHQMAVVSTDGLLIAFSLLFISFILHQKFSSKKLPLRVVITVLAISACVIASKPGYWPLLATIFILVNKPKHIFKAPSLYYLLIFCIAVFSYIGWFTALSIQDQVDMRKYFERANPQSRLITKREFLYQAINPATVSMKFYNTYVGRPSDKNISPLMDRDYQPSFIFNTFIGSFASLNIYPPSWLSLTVVGSLILGLFLGQYDRARRYVIAKRIRIASVALCGLSFIMLSMIFWMSWTTRDMPFIFGVQGRYFIPLLTFFVFLVPSKKIVNVTDTTMIRLLVALFVINSFITVTSIYNYFYV